MTSSEEAAIDAHILKAKEYAYETLWSVLNKDKAFYGRAIADLLRDGYLHCSYDGTDDIVGFTRILHHIGLEIQHTPKGLELKENAKFTYREKRIYRKTAEITYHHEKRFNRVGKDEPEEGKLGWNERRFK